MAKVLRRGNRQEEAALRATCRNCQSLIEFTRAEARFEPDVRGGDALVVECPECGREVWLDVAKEGAD